MLDREKWLKEMAEGRTPCEGFEVGNGESYSVISLDDSNLAEAQFAPPLFQDLLHKMHTELIQKRDEKLKEYIKENLKKLGFTFNNDEDFITFIGLRLTLIQFQDRRNYYEIYLDRANKHNEGILIGRFSNEINIKEEGNKITATIG